MCLYLAGLDLFSRAADMRGSSTKYLEYVCDFPASEDLPGARISLYIMHLDLLAFWMFNTSRICATFSTNKKVQSFTFPTLLMHCTFCIRNYGPTRTGKICYPYSKRGVNRNEC